MPGLPPSYNRSTGWRLRFNWGVTRRANSVWPNEHGIYHTLEQKLIWVENFYSRRDLPPRYQICPAAQPAGLDQILIDRGYIYDAPTQVQIASITTLIDLAGVAPEFRITIADSFDERWLAFYCEAEAVSATAAGARQSILQRIAPNTAYALLEIDDQPACLGLGVYERDWIGIFSMATHPAFRRRGAATALLHRLAQWGQFLGVANAYLQVMESNILARRLYERIGFKSLYKYYYREGPQKSAELAKQ
ncbi:MAG: GNAT family N-acetyltransferase [Chloroflexi bacterium]|nr:GNAT family N-acetyltransferase [Chloroflexota bacterium]